MINPTKESPFQINHVLLPHPLPYPKDNYALLKLECV